MKDKIYRVSPHNMGSKSAALLAEKLEELVGSRVLRVFPDRKFVHREHHRIVNWGRYGQPTWHNENLLGNIINDYGAIRVSGCKQQSLNAFNEAGVPTPPSGDVEWAFLEVSKGNKVYARNILRGHGGDGIEVIDNPARVVNHEAPLFTLAIDVNKEYRVHVFDGEVIHLQEKRRRKSVLDAGDINYEIRNHEGGWVYCIKDVTPSDYVINSSILAVHSLGLTFGAVDVVVDEDDNVYVLEVNSAPGLCNQSAEIYANAIVKYFEEQ